MRPPRRQARLGALLVLGLLLALGGGVAHAQDERLVYERARKDYQWLLGNEKAREVYQNWQGLYDRFAQVYTADPRGPYASQALWWMGRVRGGAYEQFQRQSDFLEALDLLRRVTNHFPHSRLADDAQFNLGRLHELVGDRKQAYLEYLRVTANYPRGDMVPAARKRLDALEKELRTHDGQRLLGDGAPPVPAAAAPPPAEPVREAAGDPSLAVVDGLRHWSTPTYSRVVVSLERPVPYTTNLMGAQEQTGGPRRLHLDLRGARLRSGLADKAPLGEGLLKAAKVGQAGPDTVRLVLDVQQLASYKVFTLDNPFRVVVDCFGQEPKVEDKRAARRPREPAAPPPTTTHVRKVPRGRAQDTPPDLGLAAQLGLCVRRVVIDPGHGGKDPGAIWQGVKEKDIVLDIAQRVRQKVSRLTGCEALLTRSKDVFLPLESRTAFANTHDADLFVSIHINAASSHRLNGIETYFLNLASDEESMRVAARENATTRRSLSDLQVILNDLMLNSKINESNQLARTLQQTLIERVRRQYTVQDLKVKQAPFYVLIGARMPAVLTEVGFLTNAQEHQRLTNPAYRDQLAEGIAEGIAAYSRHLKTAAR